MWVADAGDPDEPERRLTQLGRIFTVPEGEPVQAVLEHVATLSQGERLWFEQGMVAGDTVLIPHEALSDTPAYLTVPRLMRGFRCAAGEAAGLAELFVALDAGCDIVAHYEAEARSRSVTAITEDLVHLIARLALAEAVDDADALAEAERLGEAAEALATDGRLTERLPAPEAHSTLLGWHALGAVVAEPITCAWCGARYLADDETAELPACPACGTPDTRESRQGPPFRALVREIDGCATLTDLAQVGMRLYALRLPHDQAGVAWTHYQLRKATLEGAITLGAAARALVARIEGVPAWALARLGAELYRAQRAGAAITPAEWRRVWGAYRARRPRAA